MRRSTRPMKRSSRLPVSTPAVISRPIIMIANTQTAYMHPPDIHLFPYQSSTNKKELLHRGKAPEGLLGGLQHLFGLLQFLQFAFFFFEFLSHSRHAFFLLGDLLKDHFDRGLLDPRLA